MYRKRDEIKYPGVEQKLRMGAWWPKEERKGGRIERKLGKTDDNCKEIQRKVEVSRETFEGFSSK